LEIQPVKNKKLTFLANGNEYSFVKPYFLLTEFKLIKGTVKGSTLCWYLKGKFITYNQIKKIFTNDNDSHIQD